MQGKPIVIIRKLILKSEELEISGLKKVKVFSELRSFFPQIVRTVDNIKEAIKAHAIDVRMNLLSNYKYPATKTFSLDTFNWTAT